LGNDSFIMPDGKEIKIDMELIAEDGLRSMLKITGFGGATPDGGLRFSYLPEDGEPDFSKDTKFKTVRIRSNIPLQTNKIYWVCSIRY